MLSNRMVFFVACSAYWNKRQCFNPKGCTSALLQWRVLLPNISLGHVLNVPIMVSRFVAWMAIDQRRIEAMRDGLLPCCITHKDWTPSKCSQKEIGKVVMTFLADLLSSALYKVSCLTKVKLFINFLTQITPLTNTTNVGLNLQVFQIGLF